MSILVDKNTRLVVQGVTGREGAFHTARMIDYGTNVVSGVTPGKGGQTAVNLPVFDTVQEAWENVGPLDISVLFIPAPLVKSAALEASDLRKSRRREFEEKLGVELPAPSDA